MDEETKWVGGDDDDEFKNKTQHIIIVFFSVFGQNKIRSEEEDERKIVVIIIHIHSFDQQLSIYFTHCSLPIFILFCKNLKHRKLST